MKRSAVFSGITLFVLALTVLSLPTVASAQTVYYSAVIRVDRVDNGSTLGYISKNSLNNLAQYRYQPDLIDALIVDFTLHNGDTAATGIDLITENSDIPTYVNLGLVQGRDDANSVLRAGSFHYAYIANTAPTPPDSPPQTVGNSYTQAFGPLRTSESAVWTVNVITGTITPVWTNPDFGKPDLDLFIQSTALYVGGDQGQFNGRYPAPIIPYTLHLVILSSSRIPPAIDRSCPCVNDWKNHGAYVSCVSNSAQDAVAAGLISAEEEDAIVSEAARSSCGKKK